MAALTAGASLASLPAAAAVGHEVLGRTYPARPSIRAKAAVLAGGTVAAPASITGDQLDHITERERCVDAHHGDARPTGRAAPAAGAAASVSTAVATAIDGTRAFGVPAGAAATPATLRGIPALAIAARQPGVASARELADAAWPCAWRAGVAIAPPIAACTRLACGNVGASVWVTFRAGRTAAAIGPARHEANPAPPSDRIVGGIRCTALIGRRRSGRYIVR